MQKDLIKNNLVIIIGGSTGSGKSSLAMDLAIELNGTIINADSMQIYKYIPIITACPSEKDKEIIPHKLYEIFEPSHHGAVSEWLKLACEEIRNSWKENKIPIIVGGTGMYIDSLINGTSPIPETSKETKNYVLEILEKGLDKAHAILSDIDKESSLKISKNDTTRIRRALEVFYDTKTPISKWHKQGNIKPIPEANFFKIKLTPTANDVDEQCYLRFDKMIENGAIEEVSKLKEKNINPSLPAMKALGIPEIILFLNNSISKEEAIDKSKLKTRQYAKRQRTWFNNKFESDLSLSKSYNHDKNVIKSIKNLLHKIP